MQSTNEIGVSKKMWWTGTVLSTLLALFMLMDGVMKLIRPAFVVKASAQLGYAASTLPGIGMALVIATVLYLIPRSAVLGALLLTGYLGGAVATNVRAGTVLFNIMFPIIFGILIWGGLWLRDVRVRALIPFNRRIDQTA